MKLTLNPIEMVQPLKTSGSSTAAGTEGSGFGELLKNAVNEVNGLQQESADMKTKLVSGQIDDIHQVMIAGEKADLAFQLTLQIRNKVIEAYQEIMRMQV